MAYDSRADTLGHIRSVQAKIFQVIRDLLDRAEVHDESKLSESEKPVYDKYTPKLRALTYGSDEYKAALEGMGETLQHHYEENSHHPEHYTHGVSDMDLLDLVEMVCDWKAATERHEDGDIYKSLEINRDRFGMSPQLAGILKNTVIRMGW
jgi:hypothetical protein